MYDSPEEFGYHLIVGLAGPELSSLEKNLLAELRPSGIILFGKNLRKDLADWIAPLQELLAEIKSIVAREELLISIDHEGGRVHRFSKPVTHFPAASKWGGDASSVGRAFGRELRALGFNLDFAPVLDCTVEPLNKVIGDRALACSFEKVAGPAIEFANALEAQGVLSCGKHFPGHGGTIQDSHFELPKRHGNLEQLMSSDIMPFRDYIASGMRLMMTAHVLYPEVDSENPATISRKIVTSLLRDRLGFSGAVVTDDLEMKALSHLTPAEKACACITSGVDLLLEGNYSEQSPLERARAMVEGMFTAVESGSIELEVFAESRKRIAKLLAHSQSIIRHAESQNYSLECLGAEEHRLLAEKISSAN